MARRNKSVSSIECLDAEEDIEEIGLITGDIDFGNALRTFNFAPEPAAPSTECEAYTIGRYYKLRYSTAKMLNEIKASHHDVNVYMNTIVDEAIRYYCSFCFKKGRE